MKKQTEIGRKYLQGVNFENISVPQLRKKKTSNDVKIETFLKRKQRAKRYMKSYLAWLIIREMQIRTTQDNILCLLEWILSERWMIRVLISMPRQKNYCALSWWDYQIRGGHSHIWKLDYGVLAMDSPKHISCTSFILRLWKNTLTKGSLVRKALLNLHL